jgi:hypothetical protein
VRRRARAPEVSVGPGERVLAWTGLSDGGVIAGTRDALYLPGADGADRIPWEEVEAAGWNRDTATMRVSLVGTWGAPRPSYAFEVVEPRRLLELVRERVSASVVLQRHVAVSGNRGLRVIARRAPRGDRPISWVFEFDEGVDPDDPVVQRLAEQALVLARQDVGLD